jgi:hypothetical protein
MTPLGLARKIAKLHARTPITNNFERALFATRLLDEDKEKRKYSSQKQHWIGWLSEYHGSGYYGRKTKISRQADFVYRHIVCPPMLLWLAEASGVSKTKILAAKRSALTASRSLPSMSAAIRKIIPWQAIEVQLRAPGP